MKKKEPIFKTIKIETQKADDILINSRKTKALIEIA